MFMSTHWCGRVFTDVYFGVLSGRVNVRMADDYVKHQWAGHKMGSVQGLPSALCTCLQLN